MESHLSNGKINISLLKDKLIRQLVDLFIRFKGNKTIIWDTQLMSQFNLITNFNYLKENGVKTIFKLVDLNSNSLISTDHVFYFIQPKVSNIELIVKSFNSSLAKKYDYHLVFLPERSLVCERILVQNNIFDYFKTIDELPFYLYPFDYDLLSMENALAFKEININNDRTSIYYSACALMELQILYGVIPTIYGQGKNARSLCDILLKKREELGYKCSNQVSQIDQLIIVDRSIDLVSPLITQLTYEGLIDEIYNIKNNRVYLPGAKFKKQDVKEMTLDSSDEVFCSLRDKHINAVYLFIRDKSKSIKAQLDERHNVSTIPDFKLFVDKIPYLNKVRDQLADHLLIAELIFDVTSSPEFRERVNQEQNFIDLNETDKINQLIEEYIARKEPINKVLRLICLQSQTNNGLKGKVLEFYKREIAQTYGFYELLNIENLIRSGCLRTNPCYAKGFGTIKRAMRLTIESVNEQNPVDVAYVHSYYAPLTVRLCQYLVNPGWRMMNDILKQLPEPFFEVNQKIDVAQRKRRNSGESVASNSTTFSNVDSKTILVFFLGGCTYAEISALRFLSRQEDVNAEFVVATTKVINGNNFIESMNEVKY